MSEHVAATPAKQPPESSAHRGLSAFVKAWFVLDAVLALAPPLYWAADGRTTPILGIPAALFSFLAVSLCITASLVAAYREDRANGEIPA